MRIPTTEIQKHLSRWTLPNVENRLPEFEHTGDEYCIKCALIARREEILARRGKASYMYKYIKVNKEEYACRRKN